jgi:hypothetical protein
MNNENNKHFTGSNFLELLTHEEKTHIEHTATHLAHDIFSPNAQSKQFFHFAQALDELLYCGHEKALVQAQYFANVYFEELKTKGFELKDSKENNPLKIIIDYKQRKLSHAFTFLAKSSEEKIYAAIKKEYQKYHSKEVIEIKIGYIKNLKDAVWAGDYGNHTAFAQLFNKNYTNEIKNLKQASILIEKENLDRGLEKEIPNVLKAKMKI